ncbi:MAG: CcmD family protein [Actinomycetota bacterium]
MSNTAWLIVALAVVLVAIAGYSAWILMRKKHLERRLRDLSGTEH